MYDPAGLQQAPRTKLTVEGLCNFVMEQIGNLYISYLTMIPSDPYPPWNSVPGHENNASYIDRWIDIR